MFGRPLLCRLLPAGSVCIRVCLRKFPVAWHSSGQNFIVPNFPFCTGSEVRWRPTADCASWRKLESTRCPEHYCANRAASQQTDCCLMLRLWMCRKTLDLSPILLGLLGGSRILFLSTLQLVSSFPGRARQGRSESWTSERKELFRET